MTLNEDPRWSKKAAEYKAALEARDSMLVLHECKIRRMVRVRYHPVGEGRKPYGTEADVLVPKAKLAAQLRNLKRNGVKARVVRIWQVYDDATVDHALWEHLIMAQAHRDGRNYHYAKHLMTKDVDQWTAELTHR